MRTATVEESETDGTPGNDDVVDAEALEGNQGSRTLDLLNATTEAGEPVYEPGSARPSGSLWYRWKASETEPVHVVVRWAEAFRSYGEGLQVDVYQGTSIGALQRVAGAALSVSWFAVRDEEYLIRVSGGRKKGRAILNWRQGPAPANNGFDAAVALDAEEGSTSGSNVGATLEPGEYFGSLAGTVWYTWTAPDDGRWEFRLSESRLHLLVFAGDELGDLRLISGFPRNSVRFPARGDETYRIAVASRDAFSSGAEFELTWRSGAGLRSYDTFEDALRLPGVAEGSHSVNVGEGETVEPDEPIDTGVRTQWSKWVAPSTGEYTWRLGSASPGMNMAVFSGTSLTELALVGATGTGLIDFSFQAEEGGTYYVASGVLRHHRSAFALYSLNGTLIWGPTPANDAWPNAEMLAGASGMVAGSNRYSTTERHEPIRNVGHSSLWWTFEAPDDGWYRFWVDEANAPFILAVYRLTDGSDGRELITSSGRGAAGRPVVYLQAEAEARFAIRLGTYGNAEGSDFTLRWEESEEPMSLRYVGQKRHQRWDEGRMGQMTFDGSGNALYVVNDDGLTVLGRDPETGSLSDVQFLSGSDGRASLLWDHVRGRLLVFSDCGARSYEPIDATSPELRDEGALSGTVCGTDSSKLVMDAAGEYIYALGALSHNPLIRVFALETDSELKAVQTTEVAVRDAVMSNSEEYVYGVRNYTGYVFERDGETGELTQVDELSFDDQQFSFAVSDDDAYLFSFGRISAYVYSLEDPTAPGFLASLYPPRQGYSNLNCSRAVARSNRHAADAFCRNAAYVVEWQAASSDFLLWDFVGSWRPNRYGSLPLFYDERALAASPEGRHAYIGTYSEGILIFERVGNEIVEPDSSWRTVP